jgi:uncharacterized protein (DUF1697 family)
MTINTCIALLRGINVSGHNKIPMAELRQLCTGLGWEDVQSYIQSGNLVFRSGSPPVELEIELEAAIQSQFGYSIPVVVRSAQGWASYIANNPFPEAALKEPNWVLLTLSKQPPNEDTKAGLLERADKGERVAQVGDALYIHYPDGVGRSKLTPALLDRLVGSPVTARNWRTALKLGEMAGVLR